MHNWILSNTESSPSICLTWLITGQVRFIIHLWMMNISFVTRSIDLLLRIVAAIDVWIGVKAGVLQKMRVRYGSMFLLH